MRVIVFMIMSIALSNSLFSQTEGFNRSYSFNNAPGAGRSLVVKGDTTIAVGYELSPSYEGWQAITFAVFNQEGDLLSSKQYGSAGKKFYPAFGESLRLLSNNSLLFCGSVYDTLTKNNQALAMNINSLGDTLWMKKIGGGGIEAFSASSPASNGGYYLTGLTESLSPGNDLDAYLVRVNKYGELQWQKNYETLSTGNDGVYDIVVIDGYIYLAGSTDGLGDGSFDPYLIKVDTAGGLIWQKNYETNSADNYGGTIEISKDNKLLFVGSRDTVITSGHFHRQSYISKIDTNGLVLWERYWDMALNHGINEIKLKDDGSILYAGTRYDSSFTFEIGWLGQMAQDGTILWDRKYHLNDTGLERFHDIAISDNKGIHLIGQTYDFDSLRQDWWLVRLDSMGCLEPGCDTLTGIIDISPPKEQIAVKVFPNPASEQATIVLEGSMAYAGEEIEVYVWSLSGQLVQKRSFLINGALPMLKLQRTTETSGIYLIDVVHEGRPVGSGKLLWE